MPPDTKSLEHKEGVVEAALPSLDFKILLDDGEEVIAHLAGRLRIHRIRIVPGDRVRIALSKDGTRGRIIRRL